MAIEPGGISSRADLRKALAELVAASGLSYQDLATAAGIGSATAHGMVNGPTFPRWGSLKALLRTLDIREPDELAEWRLAHERAGKEQDSDIWPGPGTANRVAASDGLHLGVHRAIFEPGVNPDSLPPYVWRDDDDSRNGVRATVEEMAREGGFLVLVGGSSVGKTRTLYEAVRALVPGWWLLQPGSADEVRDLVNAVSSDARLVVWLDELQRFLGGEGGLDAATIRNLLRGPGHVMLVGTLWPVYHSAYVARPDGNEADPYAAERAVVELATTRLAAAFVSTPAGAVLALGVALLRAAPLSEPPLQAVSAHAAATASTAFAVRPPYVGVVWCREVIGLISPWTALTWRTGARARSEPPPGRGRDRFEGVVVRHCPAIQWRLGLGPVIGSMLLAGE